jgi:uncharacterized protein
MATSDWWVDADTLESIAIGAGILGTGGGGNPYNGKLQVRHLIEQHGPVRIVLPESVPDDAMVVSVGGMGAPTVSIERIPRGDESVVALRALERFQGKQTEFLVPGEIGGSNSMRPMSVSLLTGLPVIDGDAMGRAFPELQMDTFSIYGVPVAPAALADPHHNTVIWQQVKDPLTLERQARAVTIQMGGSAGFAFPMMSGAELKRTIIPMTMTFARRIGDAVRSARKMHRDPVEEVVKQCGGQMLFAGKIVDVERRMSAGFARGSLVLEGLSDYRAQRMAIDFQNENLIARRDGEVVAIVPDLICIVDRDTAEPVTTEVLRYGLRVAVLGIPAPAILKNSIALKAVGPAAFGYDEPYRELAGTYGGDLPGIQQGV